MITSLVYNIVFGRFFLKNQSRDQLNQATFRATSTIQTTLNPNIFNEYKNIFYVEYAVFCLNNLELALSEVIRFLKKIG